MSNENVIKMFLNKQNAHTPTRYIQNGYYTYKGNTLYTHTINENEIELINYNTVIAKIKDDILYLNNNKYSATTSRIQNKIKYLANYTEYSITIL